MRGNLAKQVAVDANSKQVPSTKFKVPNRLMILVIGTCALEFSWSLVLVSWSFALPT
jgi:hypothetical protein